MVPENQYRRKKKTRPVSVSLAEDCPGLFVVVVAASAAAVVQTAECRYGPDSVATRCRYPEENGRVRVRVWAGRWKRTARFPSKRPAAPSGDDVHVGRRYLPWCSVALPLCEPPVEGQHFVQSRLLAKTEPDVALVVDDSRTSKALLV